MSPLEVVTLAVFLKHPVAVAIGQAVELVFYFVASVNAAFSPDTSKNYGESR